MFTSIIPHRRLDGNRMGGRDGLKRRRQGKELAQQLMLADVVAFLVFDLLAATDDELPIDRPRVPFQQRLQRLQHRGRSCGKLDEVRTVGIDATTNGKIRSMID